MKIKNNLVIIIFGAWAETWATEPYGNNQIQTTDAMQNFSEPMQSHSKNSIAKQPSLANVKEKFEKYKSTYNKSILGNNYIVCLDADQTDELLRDVRLIFYEQSADNIYELCHTLLQIESSFKVYTTEYFAQQTLSDCHATEKIVNCLDLISELNRNINLACTNSSQGCRQGEKDFKYKMLQKSGSFSFSCLENALVWLTFFQLNLAILWCKQYPEGHMAHNPMKTLISFGSANLVLKFFMIDSFKNLRLVEHIVTDHKEMSKIIENHWLSGMLIKILDKFSKP